MEEGRKGPLLSDQDFFGNCVNLDFEGMERVKECVRQGDYRRARAAMAAHIREYLEPERFFQIPYETPENLYKHPGESDEEACKRVREHTLISVGVPCEYGRENPVDWQANPTYNGYREWTWQLNRHNEWKMLAHEYRRTGEEWLAETAAELFASWVGQAVCPDDCPGYLTDCWRTIECGIRMGANWPYVLFSFYRTDAFTDDVLIDWYKSVWEHGERLSRNHMTGNWLVMEMNGLAQIGILYPQFIRSKEWLEQAFGSLEEELERQIYPDGFQYELSTGYHDVVVNNYQRLIQTAKAFGQPVPERILEKLGLACELDMRLMMPDGTVPDLNDGTRRSVAATCRIRERILPENRWIRWMTGKEENFLPAETSMALPWSGFLVMRTGWTPQDTWALFDAAPFGRAHQHEDKLSVLLYAGGKLLLTEGGNYAYDSSEMRKYVLSTRSHNTIRVDGRDQNRLGRYQWKEEEIHKKADLTWKLGETWDFGESSYTEGYGEDFSGPVHSRRVFFYRGGEGRAPFLAVADRMDGEESHLYEQLWHIDSKLKELTEGKATFAELDVAFSAGAVQVITGQKEPEWQGFAATGTGQGMYRPVPCVSVSHRAGKTRLVTVLAPHREGGARVAFVKAGTGLDEEEITILYEDGSSFTFRESDAM